MSEEHKMFHQLEMMQELGLIKGNLTNIYTQKLKEKQDEEQTKKLEDNQLTKELENHMVLPTIAKED